MNPACQWVVDGQGFATRKYDGACVMFDGEHWWSRREVKPGKAAPFNYAVVNFDEVTGKTMGWEPAEQSAFWKHLAATIEDIVLPVPGTYEFCGPKVNGNPEGFDKHVLVSHEDAYPLRGAPRTYEELARFLAVLGAQGYEGIVWHHPDGRMAKLKVRDFPKTAAA